MDASQSFEMLVRLGCFFGLFILIAALEAAYPRRTRRVARGERWPSNIGISALNQLITRLVTPVSTMTLAIYVEQNQWGLFGQLQLPLWVEVVAAILILDLAIYGQHVAYHVVPVLWRLHRMHHADIDFDVTTGIRFHPLSIVLSGFIKLAVVLIIGPAAVAVLLFEVLLNATSLFNHSNLKVPLVVERFLRLIIVTPDMHRVHHSTTYDETNSNFGFNFPWWDRLFGTYIGQPALGHETMVVGLDKFDDRRELRLVHMLSQPFRNGMKQ